MIKRHSEYLLLHNANCDAMHPKSAETLRSELRGLERVWTKKVKTISLEDEDFDNKAADYRKSRLLF